jgi:hypothetical protein
LRVLCVVCVVPAALLAQNRSETATESFSIQTLLAAPFPEDLTAAPNGRALAWLADEAGRRNVWVAEAPEWRARRLTSYLADDGQELSGLVWTADGRGLLYVRGGDSGSNWDRPVPVNPTSDQRHRAADRGRAFPRALAQERPGRVVPARHAAHRAAGARGPSADPHQGARGDR